MKTDSNMPWKSILWQGDILVWHVVCTLNKILVEVGQTGIKNESHLVKHLRVLRTSRTECLILLALGQLTNFGRSDDLDQSRRTAKI